MQYIKNDRSQLLRPHQHFRPFTIEVRKQIQIITRVIFRSTEVWTVQRLKQTRDFNGHSKFIIFFVSYASTILHMTSAFVKTSVFDTLYSGERL